MKVNLSSAVSELNEYLSQKIKQSLAHNNSLALAVISFAETENILQKFGSDTQLCIKESINNIICTQANPEDVVTYIESGEFHWFIHNTDPDKVKTRLGKLSSSLFGMTFHRQDECPINIELTPIIGYALYPPANSIEQLYERAELANHTASTNLDLVPVRYHSSMDDSHIEKSIHWLQEHPSSPPIRLIFQISAVIILGWILPFFTYAFLDSNGIDITNSVYIILVLSMVITSSLIWIEGLAALKKIEPPELDSTKYPPASAIIAAYLPNESDTIIEAVRNFLQVEYPNDIQVILAYNTPHDLPVEIKLRDLTTQDSRLVLHKVNNSQSKAQNVNSALRLVSGEFVGIFDADHHPQVDSFRRAWRWLADGYDIVQGHCLVRNGASSLISRLVAIEFESIYAVSHPGRAKLHQFAIFGGSNGYWRTSLLEKTRMHGFMLTEDIDSAIRVIKAGFKIKSDPNLISTELAPLRLKALWNQRLRWAQGWFQVSKMHLVDTLTTKQLSLRQKIGMFWLLGWREIYLWISIQMYPLILYWIIKYHGADHLNWLIPIFVITTVFTLSVGPGQVFLAYKLSDQMIKKHKKWFFFYLIISSLAYAEFKNWVGRIAQMKELMGEKQWKITPRGLKPPTR